LEGEGRHLLDEGSDTRAAEVLFSISGTQAAQCGLMVHAGEGHCTRVGWDAARHAVFIDRGHSGFVPEEDALYAQRRWVPCPPPTRERPLVLRVLVDASSVELFVGHGELTLTEQTYPAPTRCALRLYSQGGNTNFGAVQAWPLKRAEIGLLR
jgi:sucrose-6-phosphate hydrolase SacC (GH32 family)